MDTQKKLIQILLTEHNSQENVSKIVESAKAITKNLTILVSDNESEELIKRGLQVFKDMDLMDSILSLEFFGTYFSAMIHHNHIPTAMEKYRLKEIFEKEIGYPINLSL